MGSFDQACPSFKVQNSNTQGAAANVCPGTYVKDPDLQAWINENNPTCRLQKVYSFDDGWQWSFIVTGQGGNVEAPEDAKDIAFLWHPTKLTFSQKIYADLEPQPRWGGNDFTAIGAGVPAAGGLGAALTYPLLSDQISTIDISTSYVRKWDSYLSVPFQTGSCTNGVAQPPFQTHTKWDFADSLLDKNVADPALRAALTDFSGDDIDKCTSDSNSNGQRWWLKLERESVGDSATISSMPPLLADGSVPTLRYNFDGTGPISSDGTALDFDYCPSPFAKDPAMRAKTSFAEGESVELEYDYAFTVNKIEGVAKVNLLFEDWRLGWTHWNSIHGNIQDQLDARQDPAVPDDPATDPRPTMGKSWMLPGINLDTTHDSNCPTDVDWSGTGLTVTPGGAACADGGLYSPGSASEFGFILTGGPDQNASPHDYSGRYVVKAANEMPMSPAAIGDIWDFSPPNLSGLHLISLRDANGDPIPGLDQVASFSVDANVPMAAPPVPGVTKHGTLNFYNGGHYGDLPGGVSVHYGMHWSLEGICLPEEADAPSGVTAVIASPTEQEAPSGILATDSLLVVAPLTAQAPLGITAVQEVAPSTAQAPLGITAVIVAPTEAQAPRVLGLLLDTDEDGIPDVIEAGTSESDTDGDGIPDIDDLTPGLAFFTGRSGVSEYQGYVYSELADCVCGPFVGEQITALTSVRNSGKMVCVTKDLKIKQTNLLDFKERDFPEPPSGLWSDLTIPPSEESGSFVVGNKEGAFSYRNKNLALASPFAPPHTGYSTISDPLYFESAYLAVAETAWMHLGNEHNNKQVHRLDFNFSTGSFGHLWAYIQSDSEQGQVSGQYKGLIKDNVRVFTNIRGRRFRVKLFIATHKSYPWNLREMAVGYLVGKSF